MLTEAIIVGMSPHAFWHDDPKLFFNYIEAYRREQERKYKAEKYHMNFTAWLHGLYIDRALKVNPAMGKSKQYLTEPIKLSEDEETKVTEKAPISEEEKQEFEKQLAVTQFKQFGRYSKLYNKEFYGEEDGE